MEMKYELKFHLNCAYISDPSLLNYKINKKSTLINKIDIFRHSTLQHAKLKKLDVSGCNLDRPGLHGLPFLTHARLSRNKICMLPGRIFAKNRELGFLYLNSNGIDSLNANTFDGLVKLQVLDLSANSIEMIHPLTFNENVELKSLNLSFNNLHELPNFTSSVTSLDASSNGIVKLADNFLSNMPKIRSINLSDNRLEEIPSTLKSTTLKNLGLHGNRIMEVDNDTFLHLPQLIRIDLSGLIFIILSKYYLSMA